MGWLDRRQVTALASGKVGGSTIAGIIMVKRLRIAVVPLIAGTIVALTTGSAWAFSQQVLTPNGNYNLNYSSPYNFNYGSPDDKAKLGDSTNKSDSNGPSFHFNVEGGQTGQFGFHNFGGENSGAAWDRFSRPVGNGN
jgi:hypothetical protein